MEIMDCTRSCKNKTEGCFSVVSALVRVCFFCFGISLRSDAGSVFAISLKEMMKSMLVDLKQPCVICGEPVGIFLLNQDDGLKMCSNTSCDWPFSEDSMELYDFSNLKLKDVRLDGPCSSIDSDFISTHIQSIQPVIQTHSSKSEKHSAEVIDLCDENNIFKKPKSDVKALPPDEEKYLFSSVRNFKQKWQKMRSDTPPAIKDPWMLRQLEISKQRAVLAKSKLENDIMQSSACQYSMKISTSNEGTPAIQIQILPLNRDCENEGSEVSENSSLDQVL